MVVARASVWRGSCLNTTLFVWLLAETRGQTAAAEAGREASLAVNLFMPRASRAVTRASVWRGSCFNAMLVVWLVAVSRGQRAAAGAGREASLVVISLNALS